MPGRETSRKRPLDDVGRAAEQQAARVRRIIEDIERERRVAKRQGRQFTAPTPDQLREKLKSRRSPLIVWQGWDGGADPGGIFHYNLGIANPDPETQQWLFVHVFVGPAAMTPDVSHALLAVDARFPRLTQPQMDGLSIEPGATDTVNFALPMPAQVEDGTYLGNAFLFQAA